MSTITVTTAFVVPSASVIPFTFIPAVVTINDTARVTHTTSISGTMTVFITIPATMVVITFTSLVLPTSDATTVTPTSSDSSAIIGGAVGGVILLLMITVVLCIVILCVRRCHRKGHNKLSYNFTELKHKDVAIYRDPSYDVTKANTVDSSYSLIKPGDSDVPITTNPSYNVPTKPYSKTGEDEYNYVQPNEFNQHSDSDESIKIITNPSYIGVVSEEDRATIFNATSDAKAHYPSYNATTKEYDYAYAHDSHLLHHNTVPSTTGDTKVQIHAAVNQSHHIQPIHSPYLSLVGNSANENEHFVINNQPKCDL